MCNGETTDASTAGTTPVVPWLETSHAKSTCFAATMALLRTMAARRTRCERPVGDVDGSARGHDESRARPNSVRHVVRATLFHGFARHRAPRHLGRLRAAA